MQEVRQTKLMIFVVGDDKVIRTGNGPAKIAMQPGSTLIEGNDLEELIAEAVAAGATIDSGYLDIFLDGFAPEVRDSTRQQLDLLGLISEG